MAEVEAWLRGPIEGVPALLQPVAHALLQAREEVNALADELPPDALWTRPGSPAEAGSAACAGFHLAHLDGVLDRMLTYARGEPLSPAQLAALDAEGRPDPALTASALADAFARRVDQALDHLRRTSPDSLTEVRVVGRDRLPSTVIGLLVHAAEHTTRHVGQLLVTVRVVAAEAGKR